MLPCYTLATFYPNPATALAGATPVTIEATPGSPVANLTDDQLTRKETGGFGQHSARIRSHTYQDLPFARIVVWGFRYNGTLEWKLVRQY